MITFEKRQKIVSYCLKGIIFVSAILGTVLSAIAGRTSFMGGSSVFMYFTIQSNLALAVLCLVGGILMIQGKVGETWLVVKYVGTISITLTGAVFCFVLAPTMGKYAWSFPNILTHVVVPIVSIVDFFLVAVQGNLKKKHVVFVILPPLAYAIYAGIGYAVGLEFAPGINYPYFFLNWGSPAGAFGFSSELPFMGCVWWILALLILLIGVGLLYLTIVNLLKKKK